MLTLQEWLRKTDENDLVGELNARHPSSLHLIEHKDVTVRELLEREKKNFTAFIQMLRDIEITPNEDGKEYIFFGSKALRESYSDTEVYMCCLDDIRNHSDPTHYSCLLVDFSEMVGYYIADTPYTQCHIMEVLADLLYESTFTGFTQEEKDLEKKRLDEAAQEVKTPGACKPIEELWKSLGMEPEPPDEEADALLRKVHEAEFEFDRFCFLREVKAIRETI